MPYTADHSGSSWVALTPMRWETEEGRWARAGGLREAGVFNTRGLCHPGRGPRVYRGGEMSRLGLGFVRRRSRGLGEGSVCTWGFGPPAWLSSRPGSRQEGRAGHRATLSAPGRVAGGAAELTVAEEPGGAGTLGVVVLAELALVAAVAVAHAVAALALALPRARLVVTLPQARLRVAQRARGAVAVAAAPRRGATDSPTARGRGGGWAVTLPFHRRGN